METIKEENSVGDEDSIPGGNSVRDGNSVHDESFVDDTAEGTVPWQSCLESLQPKDLNSDPSRPRNRAICIRRK